ncbi:MAG: hypothetical protein IJF84_02260 [Thermoguttaceae bacterium]|nr:hypothetical protein [Thermoguttaceae bacterium]
MKSYRIIVVLALAFIAIIYIYFQVQKAKRANDEYNCYGVIMDKISKEGGSMRITQLYELNALKYQAQKKDVNAQLKLGLHYVLISNSCKSPEASKMYNSKAMDWFQLAANNHSDEAKIYYKGCNYIDKLLLEKINERPTFPHFKNGIPVLSESEIKKGIESDRKMISELDNPSPPIDPMFNITSNREQKKFYQEDIEKRTIQLERLREYMSDVQKFGE